jgi:hypothetical protein
MKNILLLPLLLASSAVSAHPGHGKPGLFHDHSLADLFADGAMILAGVSVLAWLCWKAVRALKKSK